MQNAEGSQRLKSKLKQILETVLKNLYSHI